MMNRRRSFMMGCYRCLVVNSCWRRVMSSYHRPLMVDWYCL